MSSALQCDSPCVKRAAVCLCETIDAESLTLKEHVSHLFVEMLTGNENGLCWFEERVGPKGSHCVPQIDLLSRLERLSRRQWFCRLGLSIGMETVVLNA
jgi:hypothetical protein